MRLPKIPKKWQLEAAKRAHSWEPEIKPFMCVVRCDGQTWRAGMATTRGCLFSYVHLQPCPGGHLVYQLLRPSWITNCIEASGDSPEDVLRRYDERKEEERKKYAKPAKPARAKRTA